jgi:maltose O-acetyltransferase
MEVRTRTWRRRTAAKANPFPVSPRLIAILRRLYESGSSRWLSLLIVLYRPRFAAYGKHFWFDPMGDYTFSTISVGADVQLNGRPCLIASRSRIVIGSHVMFGPGVTIIGGNHRIDVVGRFMTSIREEEKRPEDDHEVAIEDDVSVGTRAVILSGVRIGRGAVVGAGAVVTKSVLPYGTAVGNPARVRRFRWDVDTIIEHERCPYPEDRRLKREDIEAWRSGPGGPTPRQNQPPGNHL